MQYIKLSANIIHKLSSKEDFMTGTLLPTISPTRVILKLLVALTFKKLLIFYRTLRLTIVNTTACHRPLS
jgi:hypothetical protein